jgi:adenylosuccinate lyase
VDTAYAVQLKRANKLILDDLKKFTAMLSRQAKKYSSTPIIGRTHGIHADITSFGLK